MSLTLIEAPALASAPVPTMRSLLTSLVGGGPEGGVTVGGLESGPLVGVVGVVAGAVDPPLELASFSADLFSSPTPIVLPLELLEPQPAMRMTIASAARPRVARERGVEKALM